VVVKNSREEIEEIVAEDEEDINDIRRKIKKSMEENENPDFIKPQDFGKENNVDQKGGISLIGVSKTYPASKRYRLRENEFLIQEIAEVLDDGHSLGAFRTVVDKIPKQNTYDQLNTIYNKSQQLYKSLYDAYLFLGNFTELILYIYITDNIDKKILNLFKFDFGIKKII
jgi:hypothetical protein